MVEVEQTMSELAISQGTDVTNPLDHQTLATTKLISPYGLTTTSTTTNSWEQAPRTPMLFS